MELEKIKLTKKRAEICERLELRNTEDVFSYYPIRYEIYEKTEYKDFVIGRQVCFVGELISFPSTFRRGRLTTTRFQVLYEEEVFAITIFNRPWIRNIPMNEKITVMGKYEGKNRITATNYHIGDITGEIIPIYSLKEGITQNEIRKLFAYVYQTCERQLEDELPVSMIEKHQLIDYKTAILQIHQPQTQQLLKQSISRLKYEEFLRFYVAMELLKNNNNETKIQKKIDLKKVDLFIRSLGFELTQDQKQATEDLINDLRSERVMYRLIQGEVGSGKTAVSMIGLYANHLAGYQGALMAPTEILAKQHYESFRRQLEPFGVKIAVLYSAMNNEKQVKEMIANGEADIIIGTHALFSEDVIYHNLGLVVADEQHRFGVQQRAALSRKGDSPHVLVMSATPIPRTLSLIIYGEMDISIIDELPPGRMPVETFAVKENMHERVYDFIRKQIALGGQAYIICPMVDENEQLDSSIKSAKEYFGYLHDEIFPDLKVGFVHGKIKPKEKEVEMSRFTSGETDILVATTVVEVGVDVPNATLMVVENADRFGLSQLHQLRGRVGRGDNKAYCILFNSSESDIAKQRLDIICKTNDGFKIAESDLAIRGPGDFFGRRQHGLPEMKIADIAVDVRVLNEAKTAAEEVLKNDPDLTEAENFELRKQIERLLERSSDISFS